MPDVSCSIDGKTVTVPAETTVLMAAGTLGIRIPALCNPEGLGCRGSCMVCLVRDRTSGDFFPACSTSVVDGMRIDASSEEVRSARGESLRFLLSEHAGDCTSPCTRACPAGVDPGRIMELVRSGREGEAADELLMTLPLPETASWLCGGLCEKACRRLELTGGPVPFRALKRILSGMPAHSRDPVPLEACVLVIGAGAAGLSAVRILAAHGVGATLTGLDEGPGGELLEIASGRLPSDVLSREIRLILELPGVSYVRLGARREDSSIRPGNQETQSPGIRFSSPGELVPKADAVLITDRSLFDADAPELRSCMDESGPSFDTHSGRSEPGTGPAYPLPDRSRVKVFSLPSGIKPGTVAAMAGGRDAAYEVLSYLSRTRESAGEGRPGEESARLQPGAEGRTETSAPRRSRSPSTLSRLPRDLKTVYLRSRLISHPDGGIRAGTVPGTGGTAENGDDVSDAERIAALCYGCGCEGAAECGLSALCGEYGVRTPDWEYSRPMETLVPVFRAGFIHESSKCILCGRCVREAEKSGGPAGLSMFGRGLSTRLFITEEGEPSAEFLDAVCSVCPTVALRPDPDSGRLPRPPGRQPPRNPE